MNMIKPKMLTKGSTIAVISPSWGGPSLFPRIYEKGIENLKEMFQFNIIEYPTARMVPEKLYGNPELRARDINDAFADDKIDAIFASIGGNDSIRILKYLDVPSILKNPKMIMGYSDSATFLTYLNTKGLVTFHGPSIMSGWAQIHNFDFLEQYYCDSLMTNNSHKQISPFSSWSSGYPDWSKEKNTGEILNLQKNTVGFIWLQGDKKVTGRIWGGCIEVLDWMKGTDYWPDKEFWNDRILIIETSEDKPTPEEVGFSLRNLGVQGILDKITAILIGRPKDFSNEEKKELYETVCKVVSGEFGKKDLVIVANMDFGHTDPNMIIPMGIRTEIDPESRTITFTEPFYKGI